MNCTSPERRRASTNWIGILLLVALGRSCPAAFASGPPRATPAESIVVAAGFAVELLHSATPEEGSWISMAFDDRGRLILGRDDQGLMRLTLADHPGVGRSERINDDLKHCRGVLWAHESLYVSATDSAGLYRLRDRDRDDRFESVERLTAVDYRSRYGHGSNQITLGPDGQIYWTIGNDVSFPQGMSTESPYRDPREDHLLPNPHDGGQDRRVGYILRSDPEGREWTVLAGGFRNPVDLAFDADGEMFTFDADMEWDVGMPWYRPIRINHVIPGGEYGWRWGTGKWPAFYNDSLPSTLDIGLGSPTGILFGTHSRFPEAYRRALFLADWQNGRILLARTIPSGCSYRCEYEVFLSGAPLNVCDMAIGPDGAMYFITGGRGSQSGLYRVRCVDERAIPGEVFSQSQEDRHAVEEHAAAIQRRWSLEPYQRQAVPGATTAIWPHLASDDAWLRFAARVAIERQDVREWAGRAIEEPNIRGRLTALTALARVGGREHQAPLLRSLLEITPTCAGDESFLELLRACQLSCIRQGRPDEAGRQLMLQHLNPRYPHADARANQMLVELLLYLDAPEAVGRTVERLQAAVSQEEQIHYADLLSRHRSGWQDKDLRAMADWLNRAHAFRGGRLLRPVLNEMREDFRQGLDARQREQLDPLLLPPGSRDETGTPLVVRTRVRTWSVDTLLPAVEASLPNASPARGRRYLAEAQCLRCHKVGLEGSPVGPDLTNVGKRYDARSILQSVVEPSRQIDPKYLIATYELDDGRQVTGQVVGVGGQELTIEIDAITGVTESLARSSIVGSHPSPISPMPTGLLDGFSASEIADLLAYLQQPH